ncbi:MAG: hypothetical protein U0350_01375 [Caldilineaceae bacterium]
MANSPLHHQQAWLVSFTGLIPLALTLPLLFLHLWLLCLVISGVSAGLVIAYHLRQGQGVSSLDLFSLGFAVVNAVLYLGFHTNVGFEHLDTIMYTLLFGQVLLAQVRGESWTMQYAKRSVAPERWRTRAFVEGNRTISLGWEGCFLASALISLWAALGIWRVLIPAGLLVSMALLTPTIARWYGRRLAAQF